MTREGEVNADRTCDAILWTGRCGEAAVTALTAICVHEHMREGKVCQLHAEQWTSGYRPDCVPCLNGPHGHACKLVDAA